MSDCAAGRNRHDDAHRPRRIALRPCDARDDRQRGSAGCQMQKLTARNLHCVLLRSERLRRAARSLATDSALFGGKNSECHDTRIMLFLDTAIRIASGAEMQLSDRIGRRMKLHDLHVLMAVVRAGSMRKAAAQLNTTQPHLQINRRTGSAVGVRLLDRHPQGVEPTVYGRALLDGGAAVFDDLRQAVKNIEFLADPEAGEVRILSGLIMPRTSSLPLSSGSPDAIRALCFISLVRQYYRTFGEDLYARNVDLLVARKWGSTSDETAGFEFLFDDPYFVVAGAQHPLARRRRVGPSELSSASLVLPPRESPPGGASSGSVSRRRAGRILV